MTAPRPTRTIPTSSATSTMTYLFPLLTIFWGGLFASGLILYWVVYTAYLVVQQYRDHGLGQLLPPLRLDAGVRPQQPGAPGGALPAP